MAVDCAVFSKFTRLRAQKLPLQLFTLAEFCYLCYLCDLTLEPDQVF